LKTTKAKLVEKVTEKAISSGSGVLASPSVDVVTVPKQPVEVYVTAELSGSSCDVADVHVTMEKHAVIEPDISSCVTELSFDDSTSPLVEESSSLPIVASGDGAAPVAVAVAVAE